MSNTHEYVLFDRSELDRILAMNWRQFAKIASFEQWDGSTSVREFLGNSVGIEDQNDINRILAQKTVRQTARLSGDQFYFLLDIIGVTEMNTKEVTIPKYDYEYDSQMISCAARGFERGELSWLSLLAVYNLHRLRLEDLKGVVPRKLAKTLSQCRQPNMLPCLPRVMTDIVNGAALNIADTRRFMKFLILAWDQEWPDIRICEVAEKLIDAIRDCDFIQPCIFQWFEC